MRVGVEAAKKIKFGKAALRQVVDGEWATQKKASSDARKLFATERRFQRQMKAQLRRIPEDAADVARKVELFCMLAPLRLSIAKNTRLRNKRTA